MINRLKLEQVLETLITVYESRYCFHYEELHATEPELWGKIELLKWILSDEQFKYDEYVDVLNMKC